MTRESAHFAAELEKICFSAPWSYEMLCAEGLRGESEFLCAFVDGEFAGYAGMLCVLDEGQICNVAVCPPFRRMGIGVRSLLDEHNSQFTQPWEFEQLANDREQFRQFEKYVRGGG